MRLTTFKCVCRIIKCLLRHQIALVLLIRKVWKLKKGVIRSRNSKKDRQYNDQKKKKKKGQTTTYQTLCTKNKDGARTPRKIEGEIGFSGRVCSSCSTIDARCVTLVTIYSEFNYHMHLNYPCLIHNYTHVRQATIQFIYPWQPWWCHSSCLY